MGYFPNMEKGFSASMGQRPVIFAKGGNMLTILPSQGRGIEMAQEDWKGWDRRPNGDIAVEPLMGWQSAVVPMTGLLQLQTANSQDQLTSGELHKLQLAMTAPQMRELAAHLLNMAQFVESQPLGPNH